MIIVARFMLWLYYRAEAFGYGYMGPQYRTELQEDIAHWEWYLLWLQINQGESNE